MSEVPSNNNVVVQWIDPNDLTAYGPDALPGDLNALGEPLGEQEGGNA